MTTAAWVLLGLAALFAVGDWVAVVRGDRRLEYVCKPAATLALVGVAAALDAASADRQAWFVAALVLSLVGDVFLMLPGDRLVAGLGAFLVAQVAYTVGFAHGATGSVDDYVVGAMLVALVAVPLVVRFVRALRASGRNDLVPPVIVYLVAIGAMVTSATASGNAWAIAGAWLFLASDATIAETRFVGPRQGGQLFIMVTYHLAQAGLVLSLL
jgi:uncharacterized membrane protein YhhN